MTIKRGHRFIDRTGQRFGRLVAIEPLYRDCDKGRGKIYWRCKCDCGAISVVASSKLPSGQTRSCGCLLKDVMSEVCTTHGMSRTPTYRSWSCARDRCRNKNRPDYRDYGGRGIAFDERWDSFEQFLHDMGEKPGRLYQLDRIDNDGPYSPDNCRWATPTQQTRNKRNNVWMTHNGETKCLADWARHLGVDRCALMNRVHRGWSDSDALTIPFKPRRTLSVDEVSEIRKLLASGNISCAAIGLRFGVTRSAVSAIGRGDSH